MDVNDSEVGARILRNLLSEKIRCRIADLRGRGIYSVYADKYRCIFIHIPKAAGSSVAKTLFGIKSRHLRYNEYEMANPRKFARYFKFAFVRNPWDRLLSAYDFLKSGGMNDLDRAWAQTHLAQYPDFDSFVRGWVNAENIRTWVHFVPQYHFICDDRLRIKVDYVGHYETIADDFAVIQTRLGVAPSPLPKINSSAEKKHYSAYYSAETKKIVAEVYAVDIELFSYEFFASP